MQTSALSFLAGLLLVQYLPVLPSSQWLVLGAIILSLLTYLRYWRWLCFVAGVLWALIFAMHRLSERLPESLEGIDIPIQGIVDTLPEQNEKRIRFDFLVTAAGKGVPRRLRLSWYYPDQSIKAGQQWSVNVRLKRPHGNFNSAGFDYERWLFIQGIGATGYIRPSPQPVFLGQISHWKSMSIWRQHIADRLTDALANSPNLALIKALTIGDGSSITQQQWRVFRNTGTTHLIVISGSHIALIAGLVYLLTLKTWARVGSLAWAPQQLAAIAAIIVAVFYAGLAGFSVPTQRAVIMLTVAMTALILQRNIRPISVLLLAMVGVLLFDPIAVLSASFWLSFGAVAFIIFISANRLGKQGSLYGAFKVNWVTSLGLIPLLLLFFQQISLVAPLANVVAVPVISILVVPLALLATMVLLINPWLAGKLFYCIDISLQILYGLLAGLAELPLAVINHPSPPLWTLALVVPGLLLLLAPRGVPMRWLSLVLFLPALFTESRPPKFGDFRMTLLDVGQGLSVVVQTAKHCLVFDTGGKFSDEIDMGQSVLLPFLWSQGVDKVDELIISHGDNDHIGGAQSLLENLPVQQLLSSVPQQLGAYSPSTCKAGQTWQWDYVTFTVLSPEQLLGSENDNSCVLKIQSAQGALLLSADIEANAESWLVERYGNGLKANVLVAPHHGSKTSSTLNFLQRVKPDYVLIPTGYRNQFGHPHQEVLDRYKQINTKWLTSANEGAIEINFGQRINVRSLRTETSKYWNNKTQP